MEKIEFFRIGKIVKTRGLKGDLKVYSYTDNIKRFKKLNYFYLGNNREEKFYIERTSDVSSNLIVIKIKGYDSIDSVQKFINKDIFVDRENTYELEDDELFIADMIGMKVICEDGTEVGILKDVLQYSANDVYVVKGNDSKEYLIPALYEFVPEISKEKREIIIRPIKGMLD